MKPKISTVAAAMLFAAMTAAHADVVISTKPTQNMNCTGGVCTPTAQKAVLNAGDLANMLAGGDVKVTTGSGATNIVVKDSVGWTSTSRLTLDAIQSVEIDKPVMVTGTGAMTITTNDGGTGGDLIFDGKGNVTFWDLNSSLIINGNSYTLVSNIVTLASDIASNPSGFYALAKPYDAAVDGVYGSSPVATNFLGTFEGLGNAISNLSINATGVQYVGLFALVTDTGVLRDVVITNANIVSSPNSSYGGYGSAAGILAGWAVGQILRSSTKGEVSVSYGGGYTTQTGGLVGAALGYIVSCKANVKISGDGLVNAGGLVGESSNVIQDSSASGSISDTSYPSDAAFGGLVGVGVTEIKNSRSNVSIDVSHGSFVGGIIGLINGKIEFSFSTGPVRVQSQSGYVGGLAGEVYLASISNSYATGKVYAPLASAVGGLAGYFGSYGDEVDIATSYSVGAVQGTTDVGGFIGKRKGYPSKTRIDYWDVDTSGQDVATGHGGKSGITGLTTDRFKARMPDGFDPAIWDQRANINNGYPYLLANPPPQ